MVSEAASAEPRALALVQRILDGDSTAVTALIALLWDWLLVTVRSNSSMRPRSQNEDEIRDIATEALEKLVKGLPSFPAWHAAHRDKAFFDWLRILVKNAIRQHLREELGPRTHDGEPSAKRLLNEFIAWEAVKERGHRPERTLAETAHELARYASEHLPPAQLAALVSWLEGDSAAEIGRALGVSAEKAARLRRAAVETLRRKFVPSERLP